MPTILSVLFELPPEPPLSEQAKNIQAANATATPNNFVNFFIKHLSTVFYGIVKKLSKKQRKGCSASNHNFVTNDESAYVLIEKADRTARMDYLSSLLKKKEKKSINEKQEIPAFHRL